MGYNFNEIEAKWQKIWKEQGTYKTKNPAAQDSVMAEPFYILDMFPYPSGAGLHVGHPLGYIASDIMSRYKRHQGYNVLHPMGYDSFGLPAEQYAIQTGQHPAITTEENINRYREQLDQLGFSFDWSREVRTSDPKYYRWTQWIFMQLFNSWYDNSMDKARTIEELVQLFKTEGNKNINAATNQEALFSAAEWNTYTEQQQQEILLNYRLTYLAETEVNWCPELGTVLANDEIVNGVSERGGYPVEKKKMKQWIMRITAYAERLLEGLEHIDWTESLKESQRNWIGKSEGTFIDFQLKDHSESIRVFTTRPDTLFGATFMVLAPEHDLVPQITSHAQKEEVERYIQATAKRSDIDRMADVKSVTGAFTGAYAEHPFTQEAIPVYISDYVLAGYGTGAVMSVPAGDDRDYRFAKHFAIPIPNIFEGIDISEEPYTDKADVPLINSEFLNGLSYAAAVERVNEELIRLGIAKVKTNYRLRDAVFSRQRYWGEPFPVYYKDGMPYLIPEECLPLKLPEVEKYLPTQDGDPPLGRATKWHWNEQTREVVRASNKKELPENVYPLELNTMPGWAGSSWYFYRYMEDQKRDEFFASPEALNYWKKVNLYIGGSEHATGHLLYSRFWAKFLKDSGYTRVEEPFQKLINQGMILGESALAYRLPGQNKFISANLVEAAHGEVQPIHVDVSFVNTANELDIEQFKNWRPEFNKAEFVTDKNNVFLVAREVEKMSKSKYNVVNPDDICEEYGADSLRLYEMFLGPLEQEKPWSTAGLSGVYGFLKKMWRLYHKAENGGAETFEVSEEAPTEEALKTLHQTIKKVTEDLEDFSFNTAVSSFMICVNELTKLKCHSREVLEPLVVLIAPFAPHIAEELWEKLGHEQSVTVQKYPVYDEQKLKENKLTYPISFNGKKRFTLEMPVDLTREEIEEKVMNHERTLQQLAGRKPKRVIIVPGKIVNIVG